jgi:head-tail adaptor
MTLTSSELASMRTEINKLLPDSCVIYSGTIVPDSMGGGTMNWTAAGTVSCRIDAELDGEGLAGGGLQPFERYMLTVPHGTTISAVNQVKVNGATFNVIGVNPSKSWSLDVRCKLQPVLP